MAAGEEVQLAHDPELMRWLDRIVDLAELSAGAHPDALLAAVEERRAELAELRKYRQPRALSESFASFARRRFELIDEASEYEAASREVLCLALVCDTEPALVLPALRSGVIALSHVLSSEAVPKLFGQLLKRLRELARRANDEEALRWVDAVVQSLPGD